ncbi:MAG: hypothetical protein EAX95_06680 [Candidatus Thorarchaeota archaeon]|nr:hypothetical protein [Candidatus Thorarchaeota archaeon]
MDQDEPIVIVPVFSTRRLNIAGGPPMEQAVPQDYVLASMLLRALESKNGRELEFFIKTFVPFRVHASGKENKYFLTETLGLGLGEIDVLKDIGIDKLLTKVKRSNRADLRHGFLPSSNCQTHLCVFSLAFEKHNRLVLPSASGCN